MRRYARGEEEREQGRTGWGGVGCHYPNRYCLQHHVFLPKQGTESDAPVG